MNRYLTFSLTISMTLATLAIPLRARTDSQSPLVWTNDDLARFYEKDLGPNTTKVARAMTVYDPDSTWHKVE